MNFVFKIYPECNEIVKGILNLSLFLKAGAAFDIEEIESLLKSRETNEP